MEVRCAGARSAKIGATFWYIWCDSISAAPETLIARDSLVFFMLFPGLLPFLWFVATFAAVIVPSKYSLTNEQLNYIKDDPAVTHLVTFEILKRVYGADGPLKLGFLELALFGELVPITVDNFVKLSNQTFGYGYKEAKFHRIIKDFMIQGRDYENGDGTGGRSVFETAKFPDENFVVKHNKLGRLSMANAGPNTNGAQFFITTKDDCLWLDGIHVVFGQLVGGFDTLQKLNVVETDHDRPKEEVMISGIDIKEVKDSRNVHNDLVLDTEVAPATGWNYSLFIVCLVLVCGFLYYTKVSYKKQYIIDIKDSNYF